MEGAIEEKKLLDNSYQDDEHLDKRLIEYTAAGEVLKIIEDYEKHIGLAFVAGRYNMIWGKYVHPPKELCSSDQFKNEYSGNIKSVVNLRL